MQGKTFKTPESKIHKVLLFDEINKMAYINLVGSQHRWVHEPEYKTWVETDIYGNFIPDSPAQMTPIQNEVYELEHQLIDTSDKSIYDNEEINSQYKTEENAISIQTANEMDVCNTSEDGGGMEQGNTESINTSKEESENTSEEKPKRKRTVKKK